MTTLFGVLTPYRQLIEQYSILTCKQIVILFAARGDLSSIEDVLKISEDLRIFNRLLAALVREVRRMSFAYSAPTCVNLSG